MIPICRILYCNIQNCVLRGLRGFLVMLWHGESARITSRYTKEMAYVCGSSLEQSCADVVKYRHLSGQPWEFECCCGNENLARIMS